MASNADLESEDGESIGPPNLDVLKGDAEPAARVIRVDRAIRCCQSSTEQVLGLLNQVSNAIVDGVSEGAIAFLPPVALGVGTGTATEVAVPTVTRIPFGAAIPIGAVVAIAAPLLSDLDQALGRNRLAEMVQGLADAVRKINSTKTKTKVSPCERCMMRNALPQRPNRRRTKEKVRSRK